MEKQPVILSIDDTMIEKYGEKFENCSRMFDHAAHNGSNYLNGHCFVSLLLSVPAEDEQGKQYLSIPVRYRMWTKEKSKLEIAAELVQSAMHVIGPDRPVCLCCDSWYPKGAVLSLPSQFDNLTLICSVRSDTVMFEMPPHSAGKRGRPRKYGKKVTPMDFSLKEIADTGFCAGACPVLTNLFGGSIVYAIVTKAKKTNSYRLFLCTKNPDDMVFDLDLLNNPAALAYAQAGKAFLPLSIYSLRWNIEVSFYQQKTFWFLGEYMLRSKDGAERLLNLLTLLFSSMTLLPWLCQDFSNLKGCSPQHVRFVLGNYVRQQVFLSTFAHHIQTAENISDLINCLDSLAIHLPFAL